MSEIIIGHIRKNGPGVYIGRAMVRYLEARAPSPLANPFKISSESARPQAIADYEAWLRQRLTWKLSPTLHELDRLIAILKRDGRLVLLCWCRAENETTPACHGDVVAKIIRENMA